MHLSKDVEKFYTCSLFGWETTLAKAKDTLVNIFLQNSEKEIQKHFGTLGELTDRKEVLDRQHSDLTVGSSALLYPKEIKI